MYVPASIVFVLVISLYRLSHIAKLHAVLRLGFLSGGGASQLTIQVNISPFAARLARSGSGSQIFGGISEILAGNGSRLADRSFGPRNQIGAVISEDGGACGLK